MTHLNAVYQRTAFEDARAQRYPGMNIPQALVQVALHDATQIEHTHRATRSYMLSIAPHATDVELIEAQGFVVNPEMLETWRREFLDQLIDGLPSK